MTNNLRNKIQCIERKSIPTIACGVWHSVIMADFLMSETQHPIIVIISNTCTYSSYFLEALVKL